ncbi:MAG TPA: SCO family protein [Tepidisphaeraceae bacterium]|nr:SCO family protein [Tepidisphaeraceae bacterium]
MKPAQKVLTTILWALTVLIMVSVIGAGLWRKGQRELPDLGAAPAFELTDQDDRPVTLASLRGKPFVGNFVFTRCGGPCPMMTSKMATLQKTLPAPDLQFLSISVDPATDTPAVLKAYAGKYGADESRWKFLTGAPDAVYATARGFFLTALPANDKNPIIHDERFVLVDATGKIRGYYHSNNEAEVARLKQDAVVLAEDAATSR